MKLRHDMLNHGVNVVCAQHEGKLGGLAVAWATQVSEGHVLICVGKQSTTRELILNSKAFGLSVLTREQTQVGWYFGKQSGRDIDKFAEISFHTAETGSPLLDNCATALDCRVEAVHDFADEKLIIGRVVVSEYLMDDYEPLIYREKDYD